MRISMPNFNYQKWINIPTSINSKNSSSNITNFENLNPTIRENKICATAISAIPVPCAHKNSKNSSSGTYDKQASIYNNDFLTRVAKPVNKVMCKNCCHFTRDRIGFGDGIGNCGIKCDERRIHGGIPTYPYAQRMCKGFCSIGH